MHRMRWLAACALALGGGCGGNSNPGPVSVALLKRVRSVGVPRYGGSMDLAAFALGRVAPGATPDLFLVPTGGYPGCAVVSAAGV